jgi:hypothetical protein
VAPTTRPEPRARRRTWLVLAGAAIGAALALSLSVTPALASTSIDLLGTFSMVAVTNGASYAQTWHITSENEQTGAFSGTDVGPTIETFTGVLDGRSFTSTGSQPGYDWHGVGTVSGVAGTLKVSGTFTDSNGATGKFSSSQTSAPATQEITGPVAASAPAAREVSGPVPAGPPGNADISTIASALPTPAQAFASTATVAAGVGLSLGAILLITFPSQLFNLTFQENYAEIREWGRRRLQWLQRKRERPDERPDPEPEAERGPERSWLGFAGVVLIGALAGSLLNPHFGLTTATLYGYVAVVLAICAGAAVPAVVTRLYLQTRHAETSWRPHALPAGLAVAAACVLISRLSSFEPGYLYGVLAGVAFSAKPSAKHKGHIVALSALTTITIAALAWFAWIPVSGAAKDGGSFFGLVVLDDFLASMFVSGLVGSAIGLLPLCFLPGWDLHHWHRGAWLLCFALAMFGVIEVLLIPHNDSHSNVPLVTTIILMVVFGGASIGLREWFASRRRHAEGRDKVAFRQRVHELLTPAEALAAEAHVQPAESAD